jgi:glycerol-3-phosphate dehydrogenase
MKTLPMSLHSAHSRPDALLRAQTAEFDLLIIGGGITGAGIALDAASRGMQVLLLEKNDFAYGTSSRSTKLIHGGLRYLKQLEIGLVREVGSERATVHQLAPHLVRSEQMLLPLVKGGSFGKLSTSLGLWVYDRVAGVRGTDKRQMLSTEQALKKEPLLNAQTLLGAGLYAEYRTDDARLTIELLKVAGRHGALCFNYLEVTDFLYRANRRVAGVKAFDHHSGNPLQFRAKYVVSAAGPWVDQLREKNKSKTGKTLFLSKGVHLVVSREHLPLQQAAYFDVPDGRMIFAIPRNRCTYIGTTDTPFPGSPDQVQPDAADRDYLLQAVNATFPDVHLKPEHVESSWAGLRPLIHEPGKSASEMSRKDEIFESPSGLISIAGGKLTGYRKMAERIVDLVAEKFRKTSGITFDTCHTAHIPLSAQPFARAEDVRAFEQQLSTQLATLRLPSFYAAHLCGNYGRSSTDILANVPQNAENPEEALALAELEYCLQQEAVLRPLDFINRRSGMLYFNMPTLLRVQHPLLEAFSTEFNWSDNELLSARKEVDNAIKQAQIVATVPSER